MNTENANAVSNELGAKASASTTATETTYTLKGTLTDDLGSKPDLSADVGVELYGDGADVV
jgi:predicted Zn-dependent peptidase